MRNRRGEILDAALRLFAERGYTHTSVEDVIAAAALSGKSHFYHYFKSKEELAYAALDRLVARLSERAAALLRDSTVDPLERLDLFIDAIVALLTERGVAGGSPFGSSAPPRAACRWRRHADSRKMLSAHGLTGQPRSARSIAGWKRASSPSRPKR
jgi:AcrR family transcriptional regulator